jgi:exosortase/archaeosortase family protein
MPYPIRTINSRTAAMAAFATAALVLAVEPILWLAGTWRDPAYGSDGLAIFLVCAALFAWSASSSKTAQPARRPFAIGLLAASALVRLAGQLAAVHTVSALTLVLDIYGIGLLAGLNQRARALSPGWLAVAFAFSLPLERLVQRALGFGLQQLSAGGACRALKAWPGNVSCEGASIVLDGHAVLVDLPCSGARTLLLLLLAFAIAAALVRPGLRTALLGAALTLVAALVSNTLRIAVLAIGIARPDYFGGADVMAQPWHDLIGLAAQAAGAAPLLAWMHWVRRTEAVEPSAIPAGNAGHSAHDGWGLPVSQRLQFAGGLAALAAAALIVSLPRKPLDVSRRDVTIVLPTSLGGYPAKPIRLTPRESAFFTEFGGAAAKASYGAHNLLMVRSSSPLRHLHGPDECLRGAGFEVTYLGTHLSPLPTAVYRATAPGESYRVDVSFFSDKGETSASVAAAVWGWMHRGGAVWTVVQRISPEALPEGEHERWSAAVLAALDLNTAAASRLAANEGGRQ